MPPCWYKGLLVIERYFRSPKRIQIKMMPINHWASRRVKAHVKIYVLVLMVERVAELESGLPWHRIRRSLDKLPVKKLCKLVSVHKSPKSAARGPCKEAAGE